MRRGERGSLLIEALIASAIVAMVLAGAYQVVGDSAGRLRGLEARRTAYLIAQSQLAAVGAETPVQSGATAGTQGDFAWRIDITPYADSLAASAAGELYRVRVSVRPRRDENHDLAVLTSLRLGRS